MKDVYKDQIIKEVAIKLDQSTSRTGTAINTFLDLIREKLAGGNRVVLIRFGAFEVKDRKGRTGRDPHSHLPIEIKASRVVRFKPATTLRRAVRESKL